MNEDRNPARISIFRGGFGAGFAPSKAERQAGMAGDCPQVSGAGNTHLKMLKTKRLQAFQDGPQMPLFSAGSELAEIGNTLGRRAHSELGLVAARRLPESI